MSRRRTFRKLDLTRAIQAAFAAGARRSQVQVGGIKSTAEKTTRQRYRGMQRVNERDTRPAGEGTQ
jgi:hypothetical protein